MTRKTSIKIAAAAFTLFLIWVGIECIGQLYFHFFLTKKISREINENVGAFIFQKSANTEAGYDLKPNQHFVSNGLKVDINSLGIRDAKEDKATNKKRIGLIGDSVVFGFRQSQDSTLSAKYNSLLGDSSKVFNLGVAGYSSHQVMARLESYQPILNLDEVVYILNPNDFSVINTMYEGGDNGTNRYFNPPLIKTPWFLRKLIYRYFRNADAIMYNQKWYRWIFNGTKKEVFNDILSMKTFCDEKKIKFMVLPLPSGFAFENKKYNLVDMNSEILSFLNAEKIKNIDLVSEFQKDHNPRRHFDETDHLYYSGNDVVVKALLNNK